MPDGMDFTYPAELENPLLPITLDLPARLDAA